MDSQAFSGMGHPSAASREPHGSLAPDLSRRWYNMPIRDVRKAVLSTMRLADGVTGLRSRVAALDSDFTSGNGASSPAFPERQAIIRDAEDFISVLDGVTSAGDHARAPIVSAADADAVVATCRLIRRLGPAEPQLVTGGIAGHPQYWVSTGKPPWLPPREPMLSPEHFVAATGISRAHNANPFGVGLYTSTGFQGTQGMWRLYLDLGHYSSNFPQPWHVWKVDSSATARVCDATTAAQWEELALRYPVVNEDLIYPDWRTIAQDWDAVHVTIRAIAAIQGMRIQTSRGLLAPSYWDVETTFWLRWIFTSVTLVETVESADPSKSLLAAYALPGHGHISPN